MKATKALILFLTLSLILCATLCIGVSAEEATGNKIGNMKVGTFVSLMIGAALVIIIVVVCIVKRAKLAVSMKAYKSEMKKITWFSKKQTVASTVFVIVSVLAIALVVGLLDYAFFEGQNLLTKLFGGN